MPGCSTARNTNSAFAAPDCPRNSATAAVAGPMHSSTITRSILRLIAALSSSAAFLSGARLLRDRQTARNSRIPDRKGAAEVSPRYCVGVLRHSAHDGIAGKG